MRVLLAPDKFKGSLSAPDAARAMARGVKRALPAAEVDECPIADGGEGTVAALVAATRGELVKTMVARPHPPFARGEAEWGVLGDGSGTAVIEMAAASGLVLAPPAGRDPTRTTTYGTGELLRVAMDRGARKIILGIGGSATNDGGCGAAQALGVRFLDRHGIEIQSAMAGGMLGDIASIDLSDLLPRARETEIVVACDVNNPLTGPSGASIIYGPQKGATPPQAAALDRGLSHLAELWREQLGVDVETMPGAGAAGGLGGGLVAFLSARLRPGAGIVLAAVRLRERAKGCDLCLTGEGRLDGQSLSGKACLAVARVADEAGVPTIALVGSASADAGRALSAGLAGYRVIGSGLSVEESMRRAAELIEEAAYRVVRGRLTPG